MKLPRLLKAALPAAVLSAVLNTLVFFIARAANAVNDNIIIRDGKPLMLVMVIISSFVSPFIGALLLFGLSKLTKKPVLIFTIIAVAFLLFSMVAPFTIPNVPVGMRLTLALMHVVVGWLSIYFLRKAATGSDNLTGNPSVGMA